MRKSSFSNSLLIMFFLAAVSSLSMNRLVHAQKALSGDIEQLDFANGLFERDLYDMAGAEYREFINRFPKNANLHEAYFGVAESLFASENYQEAISAYKRYRELFPNGRKEVLSTLRLGQSFFFTGQYEKALSTFTAIKPKDLDQPFGNVLYFYLGKVSRVQGDREKAVQYFKKASLGNQEGKYRIFALLEIGDIFAHLGSGQAGDAEYKEAEKYYDKAYQSAPSDKIKSLALFKQGEVQFLSGNYGDAIDVFRKGLKQYPGQDIARDSLANLLLALFNIFRYEELISEYGNNQKFIKEGEPFFDIHYITARAYSQTGKDEESVALLDKILTFKALNEGDKNKVLFKKVEIFIKTGQLKKAVTLIEDKLEKSPLNRDYTIFLKAEAYYGLGDFGKSYQLYRKIVEELSVSSFVDNALYGMAHAQNSQGKTREAMELFFKYFKQGKDEAKRREALYNEILIASGTDLIDRTIKHSEIYLSEFEEDAREGKVLFLLGTMYPKAGKYGKAVDVFKQFIKRFKNSERHREATFLLAYNLQMANQFDEALEYYSKVTPKGNEKDLYYPALKNTALIYLSQTEDDNAVRMYDRLITEFKENDLQIATYLWLAEKYIADKKFKDALRILEKGGEHPERMQGAQGIAYFKAEALRETRGFKKAIKYYDIVLSNKGKNIYSGAAYIGKGLCLTAIKDYKKAKHAFEAAILKNPEDNTITMRARFEIGNIERLTNHPEQAYKYYMLVAVLYQDDFYCPEALFKAGTIFEDLQKKEEALKAYQEIVSGYGQSHLFQKAGERIKVLSAD